MVREKEISKVHAKVHETAFCLVHEKEICLVREKEISKVHAKVHETVNG